MANKHFLDDGDTVEYGATLQFDTPSGPVWLKVNASTSVRSSETAAQTWDRLTAWVEARLTEKMADLRP